MDGDRYGISARTPEKALAFANGWLVRRRIGTKQAMQSVMRPDAEDRVAHDAAWLRVHSLVGLELINSFPAEQRHVFRKLWAAAFHAGARLGSITVNLRYLPAVQAQHRRRTELPAKARSKRKPKITIHSYKTASADSRSRKELFLRLGVSGQAVREFERRNPDLKKFE
jgi:hypothetical protein